MSFLLDTGILLRLFDRNDPRHAEIRDAVRRLMRRRERLFVAAQNMAEFWSVSTRPASSRGGYGLSTARVEQRISAIERICKVVAERETTYTRWRSIVTQHQIVGVAIHDARLAAVMLDHGVSQILTLDRSVFQRIGGVQVHAPEQVP